MGNELPQLIVADAAAWRTWLAGHHDDPIGVWLTLAKKDTTEPTSLTYDHALDQARIEVPADLAAALAAEPTARAMFDILTSQNRYAFLYRIDAAKRDDTRARRIEQYVAMLAAGGTIYP